MEEAERSKRLEELFGLAIDLPAEEREAFVERHCGGDAALRDELTSLLRENDQPTVEVLRGTAAPDGIEHVGRYQLIKLLGAGGMGSVYLAHQKEPVERQVALKMIHPGKSSEEIARRFDTERQTLALMSHPCIAKIYDGGTTEDGQPYFVMEYVHGLPITEYCDRHKMGTRARLELFCRVCDAVQHAHQKAIIHRDLKPGNVLVTEQSGEPVPKIIDFGIARAVTPRAGERARSTITGGVVGTILYMSPEQADPRGTELDTRTDIYSLGVILYELLTGEPPFGPEELESKGWVEARRILCERDPPVPSARVTALGSATTVIAAERATTERLLPRALKGDLDWITMKAMEKDRNRRYSSAAELRADIERYLTDEPVLAGPPTMAYRSRKFVRRHRVGVTLSALLVTLLVASVAVTSTAWMDAEEARADAETARNVAEQNLDEAQAVAEFLDWGLFHGDPVMQGGKELTVREMLDRSAKEVTRLFAERPAAEVVVRTLVGRAYLQLGEFDKARNALREAYTVELRIGRPKLERWQTLELLISATSLDEGRDKAAAYIQESVNLAVDILDDRKPELHGALVALLELPKMPQVSGEVARERLNSVMDAFDRIPEQKRRESVELMGRVVGSVGWYLMDRKKPDAEVYFQQLEERVRDTLEEDSLEFLGILALYAELCLQKDKLPKALALAEELTERSQKTVPLRHWLYFEGDRIRGLVLAEQGEWAAAERALLTVYHGIERLDHEKTYRLRQSEAALAKLCELVVDAGQLESFLQGSWERFASNDEAGTHSATWWPVDANLDLPPDTRGVAVRVLQRALERNGPNARDLALLALAQRRAGLHDAARKTYDQLKKLLANPADERATADPALLARVHETMQD